MPVTPGARVGPYEVMGRLGEGGMGEVYRARDPRIGREVALKVLHAHAGLDPDRIRRFEQEARAAGLLNHPNILTVHDVGTVEGQPYLVTELLDGETLRERLQRGTIPVDRVLDIAAQVARGLAAAHAKGVIHRDLKPENLFLTRDGRTKILDFGIAKLAQDASGSIDALTTAPGTMAGVVMGTAAYMSPEQVTGAAVEHGSDIFSLGIVLHEMLSGRAPFTRTTSVETMTAVLNEDPPPLDSDPRVAPAVDRLVRRCLEKTADERFQSARDLAFALETLVVPGTRSSGAGVAVAEPAPRARPRHGRVPWWWVVAASACAFAAAWFARGTGDTEGPPHFDRVVKLVGTDAVETSPVLSPDAKWIAYLSDEGGRMNVWVRFLSGGQPVNLTGNAPGVYVAAVREIGGLDISPDGSEIAFAASPDPTLLANQQTTYVIAAPLGGTPRKLLQRGMGMRWSPDGRQIAYVLPGGAAGDALVVADRTGEHPRVVLPVSGGLHAHWVAWSTDGLHLYYNRSGTSANLEPTEIYRVPVAGGPEERVIETSRRALFPCPLADGLVYSANPSSADLALSWKPWSGPPAAITTGIGEYAEARMSADKRRMVATVYQPRRSLWTIPIEDASPKPLALTQGAGDSDPNWSPKVDRLAFSSTRSGDRNIWTARPDGTDARQVTSGQEVDDRPQWSPDGAQLAFVSSRGGERGVWVVSADGGTPRRVVTANVLNTVAWSPDGREIVYAAPHGDTPALFRVSVTSGTPVRIPTPTAASSPTWSAATGLIAYIATIRASDTTRGRSWPAVTTPSGERVALPDEPTLANGTLAWSADGRWLAGISAAGTNVSVIWVFPADGHIAPRKLMEFTSEARPWGVTWSPDGRRLVYGLHERSADIVLFDSGK